MTTLNLQVNASANDGSIDNIALSPQLTANLLNVGNVNGNSSSTAGLRFTSVTIPQGATITSATLTLYGYSTYSTGSTISAIAACEDVDNSAAFASSPGNFNTTNRPRTTAKSSAVNIASVTAGSAYTWDLTSSVQEVVDRAGWSSGNAISVFVDNNASSSSEWQEFESYDHSTTLAAKLDIVYTTGGGAQSVTPNLLSNTSTVYSPTVSPQAATVAPNLLTNTNTLYNPVVSAGGTNIVPDLITSTNNFFSPTVSPQSVTVAPDLLTNTNAFYSPQLDLNVSPNLLTNTNEIFVASLGTGTVDWNVQVGDGYTDVSGKQVVRTSGNVLYTVAANCDSYPGTVLTQTIRVNKSNSTGVPTGFTRKDSSNEPSAVTGATAAIDSNDDIHIAWVARSATATSTYLRYAVFDTGTDTWGSVTTIRSDIAFTDIGQGDQSVSIAIDANDKAHIVYLSTAGSGTLTNRRIYYVNNVSGSWSTPVQLDSDVTYTGNQKAWHPNIAFDVGGNILVAWEKGDFNDGQSGVIYSKYYNGSWGSAVQVNAAGDNVLVGIDQSTSLLITPDGTFHATYMLYSATNSQKYIRYRYSTDSGSTWSGNNPTNQATHNPALGWTGSKVRILGHGTPDGSNHGANLYYFEGDGGSAAWGSWTQFVTGTNYDSSVSTRWAQFHNHYPHTMDIAYWDDNYPNVLYAGTEIFALDIEPALLTNSSTLYSPTVSVGASTITPDLLTNSSTIYSPSLTLNVLPDVIDSTENVFAPTVTTGAVDVAPDLLTNSSTIYSPVVSGVYTITPDLIDSVGQVFNPTIVPGSVDVTPDVLTNTNTFYDATLTTGVTILPDTIASTNEVFVPTINPGAVDIVPDALTNSNTIYSPTVTTGSVTVEPDVLTNTNTIYNPTINNGGVTITPDLLINLNTIYDNIVSVGAVDVTPDLVENTSQVFVPDVVLNMVPDLIESTEQIFSPSIIQVISTQLLTNTNSFPSPTVTPGAVTIETVRVESTTQVFVPQVYIGDAITILPDLLSNTSVIYSPTLASRYGRIDRVATTTRTSEISTTSRTDEVASTTREYDILVN